MNRKLTILLSLCFWATLSCDGPPKEAQKAEAPVNAETKESTQDPKASPAPPEDTPSTKAPGADKIPTPLWNIRQFGVQWPEKSWYQCQSSKDCVVRLACGSAHSIHRTHSEAWKKHTDKELSTRTCSAPKLTAEDYTAACIDNVCMPLPGRSGDLACKKNADCTVVTGACRRPLAVSKERADSLAARIKEVTKNVRCMMKWPAFDGQESACEAGICTLVQGPAPAP